MSNPPNIKMEVTQENLSKITFGIEFEIQIASGIKNIIFCPSFF